MATINAQDIENAEHKLQQARDYRTRSIRTNNGDGSVDTIVAQRLGELELLRTKQADQQAAIKNRLKIEKTHKAALDALSASLAASADQTAAAARDMEAALTRLVEATKAHHQAVTSAHAKLRELGMPLIDDTDVEYDNGAGIDGTVRLAGTFWLRPTAYAMTLHMLGRIAAAEFGHTSGLAAACRHDHHARQLSDRHDGLLDRLSG